MRVWKKVPYPPALRDEVLQLGLTQSSTDGLDKMLRLWDWLVIDATG